MGNHLGVGFRLKGHTGGCEPLAQSPVVFDDPVLNHRHPAAAIPVGMGVVLFRLAMGRPASVADPAKPRRTVTVHTNGEVVELSFGAKAVQILALQRSDARGVIAAVLQLAKAFQKERCRVSRTNHRDDAAHIKKPGLAGLVVWVLNQIQ